MTLTNCYATLDDLRLELGVNDSYDDVKADVALNAASRQVDAHTGRRFWQDGSVVAREFYADESNICYVDDISTTTGLIVKTDGDDDGTFETTLTVTTHFILQPVNAADEVPVRPFTCIRCVDSSYSFPMSSSGRPGVQVTAKFGWPAVPPDVKKATLIQAVQLFKASDAVFGGLSLGLDGGVLRVRESLNPIAAALLESYCKPRVS